MKTNLKSHRGLKALTTGIAALLLALASAHVASAQSNTKTGVNAGASIATGTDNTANGFSALQFTTAGTRNTAFGSLALRNNIDGGFNTALGFGALTLKTNSGNTALGAQALSRNTTGARNTATGVNALLNNITGSFNTASGRDALRANTEGTNNVAVGFEALLKNTSGDFNVAIGDGALLNNTTGSGNIGIGEDAGFNLTVGDNNISIGHKGVAGGSGKIRIGTNGTHTDTFLAGVIHGDGSGLTNLTVPQVGGVSAVNVALASNLANAATAANAAGSIVRRDASGNFSAGTINSGKIVIRSANPPPLLQLAISPLAVSPLATLTRVASVASFAIEPSDASPNAGFIRFGDSTGWKLHFGRSRESSSGAANTGTTGTLMTVQDNGNVGLGTTEPQARLDVRGDVRMGTRGQFQAAGGEENLGIVRGGIVLGANDVIASVFGSGFQVSRTSEGHYTIRFGRPFAEAPTVTATSDNVSGFAAVKLTEIGQVTTTTVEIQLTKRGDGSFADGGFHFIAIGPRSEAGSSGGITIGRQ